MKKYISIIAIIIIILISFFIITINNDKREEKVFFDDIGDIESEKMDNKEPEEEEFAEFLPEEEATTNDSIQCLADAGLVIYGSKTCPACASLLSSLGGYETVAPIYVECSEKWDRCSLEMQTGYVPEIQIQGELYNGSRSPESIAEAVNCEI